MSCTHTTKKENIYKTLKAEDISPERADLPRQHRKEGGENLPLSLGGWDSTPELMQDFGFN